MKILTLQLTKIHAEKKSEIKDASINTTVNFTDVEKDSISILKEGSLIRISFNYILTYSKKQESKKPSEKDKEAEVLFEGFVLVSVSDEEQKEFETSWKKKQVPEKYIEPFFNIILRNCTIKAIPLQEDLNIPSPFVKIPPIRVTKK